MDERKILLIIFTLAVYCIYSVYKWVQEAFNSIEEEQKINENNVENLTKPVEEVQQVTNVTDAATQEVKHVIIPLIVKNGCSILEIFTKKPPMKIKPKYDDMEGDNNVAVFGVTLVLVLLALNAVMDVIKAKKEERLRQKDNPEERRQSLAEFANKKPLRRGSSKLGQQLFQIAEAVTTKSEEEKKTQRENRPYVRGDSTNSYLSEQRHQTENSAPASIGEDLGDPKMFKRQSVGKPVGARPRGLVRRSSFPVLPLNPDVQAAMLGHRQNAVDSSDDDSEKGRRVRLIRRF